MTWLGFALEKEIEIENNILTLFYLWYSVLLIFITYKNVPCLMLSSLLLFQVVSRWFMSAWFFPFGTSFQCLSRWYWTLWNILISCSDSTVARLVLICLLVLMFQMSDIKVIIYHHINVIVHPWVFSVNPNISDRNGLMRQLCSDILYCTDGRLTDLCLALHVDPFTQPLLNFK